MRMMRFGGVFVILGCSEEALDSGPPPLEEGVLDMDWTLEPPEFEFGEVAIGVETSASILLRNSGDSDFMVFGFQSDSERVTVAAAPGTMLPPGATAPITATWTPTGDSDLRASIELLLSGTEGLVQIPIPVVGTAFGPSARLVVDSEELGSTALGCTLTTGLLVSNAGNTPLVVSSIALDGSVGFALDIGRWPLPWTLAAGESKPATVSFTPYEPGEILATLSVVSDDPLQPDLSAQISATGSPGTQIEDTWEVPAGENVTGIFAVNEVVNTQFRDRFQEALPTFFATLLDFKVPFRVAFTHSVGGEIYGSEKYIDESFSADDAAEVALAMVSAASGDNDYLLSTLELSITANRAWLMDDDENWATAKLNLVGINSDQEQSSGNYAYYIARYVTHKSDPADIAVHAIGGDSPMGCSGAEAFTPFSDAAAATGGIFLSICEADWVPHMEALALAFLGEGQVSFALSTLPAEWSVAVLVDGAPRTSGWTYNAASNRISFDESAYPSEGDQLSVQYNEYVECPE